jgi:putative nucleotidyltransferase with HDIG domain
VAVVNVACAAAMVFPAEGSEEPGLLVYAGQDAPPQRSLWDLCVHRLADSMREDPSPVVENDLDDPSTGVHNLVALPLITGETLRGVLLGCNRQEGDFDSNDVKLMGSINHQAAIFLANSHLYADLQELLMGVLIALSETIDAKDAYTHGHSRRVARISRRVAESMGFEPDQVERVYLAGLLHDIGKIGVPERVLCKQGRLTDEEYDLMKRHPAIGAKILGGIRQLQAILPGILAHHERPDGRGYPKGLAGDDVPIEGLIVGLADTFDAMTSNRTYRKALPLEVAIEEIRTNAGAQFDPRTVEVFLSFDLEAYLNELQQPERMTFPAGLMKES